MNCSTSIGVFVSLLALVKPARNRVTPGHTVKKDPSITRLFRCSKDQIRRASNAIVPRRVVWIRYYCYTGNLNMGGKLGKEAEKEQSVSNSAVSNSKSMLTHLHLGPTHGPRHLDISLQQSNILRNQFYEVVFASEINNASPNIFQILMYSVVYARSCLTKYFPWVQTGLTWPLIASMYIDVLYQSSHWHRHLGISLWQSNILRNYFSKVVFASEINNVSSNIFRILLYLMIYVWSWLTE